MLKRLSEKELIIYEKYRGVTLTKEGSQIATNLIRKHRLWEFFLVEKLEFSWGDVHEIAEELEHVQSDMLIERLDSYLGHPKYDPHGDPIPNAEGKFTIRAQRSIDGFEVGKKGLLLGVKEHNKEFLDYLNKLNISLGSQIEIMEKNSYDGSMMIRINENEIHLVSEKVCKNLLIKI